MVSNGRRHRRNFQTVDLRADLHGRVIEYATGIDRRYFLEHPHETSYVRPPIAHEFCWPVAGKCAQLFAGEIVEVRVTRLNDVMRMRAPLVRVA